MKLCAHFFLFQYCRIYLFLNLFAHDFRFFLDVSRYNYLIITVRPI